MKKLISHHSKIYYVLKDACHFYKIIDKYFPDPKRTLKFTIMAKQGYKVDFSQANTPKKRKRHKNMPEHTGILSEKRILDCQQTKKHYIETFWRAGLIFLLLFTVPGTSVLYS